MDDLLPTLGASENIFLGHEPRTKVGNIDWKKVRIESTKLLTTLGASLDLDLPASDLSIAQKQLVSIAKALSTECKIIIMDEPSAVLIGKELKVLFDVVRRLKEQGIGIVYISHRIEEVMDIGDRITILRDGEKILTEKVGTLSIDEIIHNMVGRDLKDLFKKSQRELGNEVLRVNNLCKKSIFSGITISLKKGEILGIAGLIGAKRSEVAKAIVGAEPYDQGEIYVNEEKVQIRSPEQALENGIGLIPEDRRGEGLVLCRSVKENMALTILERISINSFVAFKKLKTIVARFINELSIKTPTVDSIVMNLSGGNQQKVAVAKWLAAECEVLIMDEPTRGIDVGAKAEIYHLLDRLAGEGRAIILISSELPEILAMSDRILVMSEGKITKELFPKMTNEEEILRHALPISKRK